MPVADVCRAIYAILAHVKRTTVYLDPGLESLLKLEALRLKRPMAEVLRDALRAYLTKSPRRLPPGMGAFESGYTDTAERAEETLGELGFGAERA